MTLEELRSRLIEVCKGKKEFVKALEMIAERVNSRCWRFYSYSGEIMESYEQPNYVLDCPPDLDCRDCPMNDFKRIEGIDCRCPNLHIPNMERDKLRDFAKETLDLAIASCKGEEVKVEVEEVPVDNPSKPLFIVAKVDDLIGLESEDGKFRIESNPDSCIEYIVIGKFTGYTYFDFLKKDAFNDAIMTCLGELGFRFTIQKKSYLEMLEECEEVEFDPNNDNYYMGYDTRTRESVVMSTGCIFVPGVKYISEKDADKILEECVENA